MRDDGVVLLLMIAVTAMLFQCIMSQSCSSFSTCSTCLTNSTVSCHWCTLTHECVPVNQQCQSITVYFVGTFGTYHNNSNYRIQHEMLEQCETRLTSEDQCVIGMDEAFLYLPKNRILVRNMREGGLEEQPLLPVTQDFLNAYSGSNEMVNSNYSQSEFEGYVSRLQRTTQFAVGAYIKWSSRSKYVTLPYTLYPDMLSVLAKGNLSVDHNTLDEIRTPSGKWIMNLFTSNLGFAAQPGRYSIGMVLAVKNATGDNTTVCLHYVSSNKIRVTSVFRDMLFTASVYVGIPLYFATFAVLCMFAKYCRWTERKTISEQIWDTKKDSTEVDEELDLVDILREEEDSMADLATEFREKRQFVSWKWFSKLNSEKLITQCGLPAYYHWKFYRRMIVLSGLFGLVTLILLIPIHITYGGKLPYYLDFSITTVASVPSDSKALSAHFILSVFYFLAMAVNIGLTIKLIYYKRRKKKSIFTACLNNLPKLELHLATDYQDQLYIKNYDEIEKREQRLAQHFNALLQTSSVHKSTSGSQKQVLKQDLLTVESNELADLEPVLTVNTIVEMNHLIHLLNRQFELKSEIEQCRDSRKKQSKIDKLKSVKKVLSRKTKKPLVSASAFITFRSVRALRTVIDLYKSKDRSSTNTKFSEKISNNQKWAVSETMMDPEDILWENIGYSSLENTIRATVTYFISFFIASILILLISLYIFKKGMYGLAISVQITQTYLFSFASYRVRSLAPIAFRIFYYVMPTILAVANEVFAFLMRFLTSYEKMKTRTKFQASYLMKTITIMLFTSLLLPFFGDITLIKLSPTSFYNNSGLKLMQFIISQLFFSKGLVYLLDIVRVVLSYLWEGGQPNRLQFDYITSYAKALVMFFTITALGTRFPLLFIPGFAFFLLNYLADTFLIAFFYEKSKGAGDVEFSLVSVMTFYFSALAIVFSPSLRRTLTFGLSFSFFAATLLITIVLGIIAIFARRKSRQRNEILYMHDEDLYLSKFAQPHLQLLRKKRY